MTRSFQTDDGRLIARVIMLAYRFGCEYDATHVTRDGSTFSVTMSFLGPEIQLRRLDAQIGKLLDYEKEIA